MTFPLCCNKWLLTLTFLRHTLYKPHPLNNLWFITDTAFNGSKMQVTENGWGDQQLLKALLLQVEMNHSSAISARTCERIVVQSKKNISQWGIAKKYTVKFLNFERGASRPKMETITCGTARETSCWSDESTASASSNTNSRWVHQSPLHGRLEYVWSYRRHRF